MFLDLKELIAALANLTAAAIELTIVCRSLYRRIDQLCVLLERLEVTRDDA